MGEDSSCGVLHLHSTGVPGVSALPGVARCMGMATPWLVRTSPPQQHQHQHQPVPGRPTPTHPPAHLHVQENDCGTGARGEAGRAVGTSLCIHAFIPPAPPPLPCCLPLLCLPPAALPNPPSTPTRHGTVERSACRLALQLARHRLLLHQGRRARSPSSSRTLLFPRCPRNWGLSLNSSGSSLFLKRMGWRTMARQRPGATGTP